MSKKHRPIAGHGWAVQYRFAPYLSTTSPGFDWRAFVDAELEDIRRDPSSLLGPGRRVIEATGLYLGDRPAAAARELLRRSLETIDTPPAARTELLGDWDAAIRSTIGLPFAFFIEFGDE